MFRWGAEVAQGSSRLVCWERGCCGWRWWGRDQRKWVKQGVSSSCRTGWAAKRELQQPLGRVGNWYIGYWADAGKRSDVLYDPVIENHADLYDIIDILFFTDVWFNFDSFIELDLFVWSRCLFACSTLEWLNVVSPDFQTSTSPHFPGSWPTLFRQLQCATVCRAC